MGILKRRTLGLLFDGDLADEEMTVTVLTVDEFIELGRLTENGLAFVPENQERLDATRALLIAHTVSWSFQAEDGASIPVTVDGFAGLDKDRQAHILDAWMDQMVALPVPLGEQSTSGPLAAIPMAPAAASRAS